jgi:C4-dicarboxylate-specific signal transduction histidine kinase
MMQYAQSDTGQRQLTEINAWLKEAVQLVHSRRSLDRSFNVTIYTEYESAIALSEVAFSLTRAFINILDSACYGVFQKQKSCQQGIKPQTESLTLQIWVKTQNLVKAVEIRRENGIRITLEIPENIFHSFFTTKPSGEATGLELSLNCDIIAGLYSGSLNVEGEMRAYTEFIITLPKL